MHSKKEGMECMKSTGITRRIDELGRIVVPKEIRKNMHIKSGELLEIYVLDENSLVLKRHSAINDKNSILRRIINLTARNMNFNIFITDFNKVIFSNKKEIENKLLNDNVYKEKTNNKVQLTKEYIINKPYSFYNLSISGDLIGYIIFEYNKNNINKEIENILLNIIENCLEND